MSDPVAAIEAAVEEAKKTAAHWKVGASKPEDAYAVLIGCLNHIPAIVARLMREEQKACAEIAERHISPLSCGSCVYPTCTAGYRCHDFRSAALIIRARGAGA